MVQRGSGVRVLRSVDPGGEEWHNKLCVGRQDFRLCHLVAGACVLLENFDHSGPKTRHGVQAKQALPERAAQRKEFRCWYQLEARYNDRSLPLRAHRLEVSPEVLAGERRNALRTAGI